MMKISIMLRCCSPFSPRSLGFRRLDNGGLVRSVGRCACFIVQLSRSASCCGGLEDAVYEELAGVVVNRG